MLRAPNAPGLSSRVVLGAALAALAPLTACGDARYAAPAGPLDASTCAPTITEVELRGGSHVPQDSPLTYISNPPAGGDHYGQWLRWARRYDEQPRGNYIHNEEHGGVVLINPCASGCDEVSEALEALGRSLPQDPLCEAPINARWVVVRDPEVGPGIAVAAAAWGWTYTSPCFDEAGLRQFIADHYAQTFEDICIEGQRP